MSEPQAAELLSNLTAGARAKIVGFDLPAPQRQRFLEMGMTLGSVVEIIRFAPLGDPLDLKVRGYQLSLRKSEASGIRVERL